MIHYHGLPITPETAAIEAIKGGHAFVSFRHPEQLRLAVDPFHGWGTTAAAAEANGRRWIGSELMGEYLAGSSTRFNQSQQLSGAEGVRLSARLGLPLTPTRGTR